MLVFAQRVAMSNEMNIELVFEVTEEADGGYVAECLTESIVTEGDTWEELRANVKDAVEGYFLTDRSPNRSGYVWFAMKCS